MFDVRFRGLRIEVTLAATRELMKHGSDLADVKEILEEGYDCSASKRQANIIEKCQRKGNKEFKAVVAETQVEYPDGFKETVWRLIHFGKTTYQKEKYGDKK